MANIPLKTLTLSGLSNVYIVPQVDDTLTQTGYAADAKAVGELKSAISREQVSATVTGYTFVQGTINSTTGENSNSNTRCRCGYISFTGFKMAIVPKSGYKVGGRIYTTEFASGYTEGITFTTDKIEVTDNTKYYRLLVAKTDDSNVTPADLPSDVLTITQYSDTDTTLTLKGKAADAKVTGDKFVTVDNMTTVPLSLSDGFYTSTGSITAQDEDKQKYTQQYQSVFGAVFNVSLEYITSNHALWVAVGEWLDDGTFYRRNLVSVASQKQYFGTYTPQSNVRLIAFMFSSFDDYTFSVTTDNVPFLALAGNVIDYVPATYDFDDHRIKGINHRGYNTAPENTMPAFKLSADNGFSFVETDVRFTADGVPVLLHDATINRTARNADGTTISGDVNIADITYSQALDYDFGIKVGAEYAGTKIPTFEEFIVFCRNVGIFPYVEISGEEYTSEQVALIVGIVKKYTMCRSVTWLSFYNSNLLKVIAYDPCARVGRLLSTSLTSGVVTSTLKLRTGKNETFVNIDSTYLDSDTVSLCQVSGLPLETWTINTESAMLGLPNYVSGVVSDSLNFEKVLRDSELT